MLEFNAMVNEDESKSKRGLKLCAIVAVIGIPYVCCAILFGLFATMKKAETHVSSSVASVGLSFNPTMKSTFLQSSSSKTGKVVSLGPDGKIYNGGGTTIYKNLLSTSLRCPKYLDLDVVFDSSLVMFYSNSASKVSTINIIKLSKDTISTELTKSITSDIFFNELATLSKANGIFVGISQCFTANCASPAVVAGRVSQYLTSITFGTPKEYTKGFTTGPCITRLSDNLFAIAYFSPYLPNGPNTINTLFGIVDPVTLDVTMSSANPFVDNSNFTVSIDIIGMTASSYLLISYESGKELKASLATVPTFLNKDITKSATVSQPVSLKDSAVNFKVATTRLDSNTAVVVYADGNNNNRVICVLVLIDPVTSTVSFGSTYELTSGTALATFQVYSYMDLDVQPIAPPDGSSATSFVVLFSDISNGGRMAATILGVNRAGDVIRQSADYILTGPNSNSNKFYAWGALAAASNGLMSIMTSVTDYNCSSSANTVFSLMEQRPRPFGVTVRDSSPSDSLSVTASGAVSGLSGLTVGAAYYSNTKGDLVSSGMYYGSTPVPGSYDGYITSTDESMILSADALVGFASAPDTLVLVK